MRWEYKYTQSTLTVAPDSNSSFTATSLLALTAADSGVSPSLFCRLGSERSPPPPSPERPVNQSVPLPTGASVKKPWPALQVLSNAQEAWADVCTAGTGGVGRFETTGDAAPVV
ncbi:hypothetical protein PG994_003626 [Apiospora phragmitis]|uniref:Ig-like domain-containing protein n=1 Tax=Apiospora phragmitis TaxID=2905665 RepID=A0ABR1W2G7_9PEZI